MMRAEFDEYIGTPPASAISIDDIARRGQRVRRRRSIAIGATVLAMLATGSFGVAQLHRESQRSNAPAATAPVVPDRPPTHPKDPGPLIALLTQSIIKHAPGVRFTRPLVKNPTSGNWEGTVTSPTGTYTILVAVGSALYIDPGAPPVDETDAKERQIAIEQGDAPVRGPNGENILATHAMINIVKPDGTFILIQAFNTETKVEGSPFTRDQLIAICVEPDLHLCTDTNPCKTSLAR